MRVIKETYLDNHFIRMKQVSEKRGRNPAYYVIEKSMYSDYIISTIVSPGKVNLANAESHWALILEGNL